VAELKVLSREGIALAIEKAIRYRVLNEPWEAESICRDVLDVDPRNPGALVTLILALTDQFPRQTTGAIEEAWALVPRLESEYEQAYYSGIIHERLAKSRFRAGSPGSGPVVHAGLTKAMECFERAEKLRPAGNDEALLRWNACIRLIERHSSIRPEPDTGPEPPLMLE